MAAAGARTIATVLLVDDERHVTEGLQAILHPEPYQVLSARSAPEALALLRRRQVDVVVSDECMPEMTGSAFLAQVAKEFPHTARIMLTGHASIEAAIAAINEGRISRFLQKPCKPSELRAAIADALHSAAVTRAASQLMEVARAEERRRHPPDETGESPSPHQTTHALPAQGHGTFSPEEISRLSQREREVFDMFVDGLRVGQVAKALFVSDHTIRNHLKAIFDKLDIHSQAELLDKGRGATGA
jgi:two-component system, probable response regulator PhcQ